MDVRGNPSSKKRLIDANLVVKAIIAERDKIPRTVHAAPYEIVTEKPYHAGDQMRGGIRKALRCIEQAPTVDYVPVVRCRECKYWGDEEGKLQRSDGALFARCKVHNYLLDGRHTGWCPTENDFCSYGDRKEGAD